MEKIPFFSIIMPVYKVEKSLYKAATSVLEQTFSDFELILVDDCSPDNSGKMCDELAATDSRIKVVHKEKNGGLGYARNTGIEESHGKYIFFMDSDDIIEKEALSILYNYIKESNADIYAFGLVQDYTDTLGNIIKSSNVALKKSYADNTADIARLAVEMDIQRNFAYACSKIYKTSFLKENGFFFTDIRLIEDFVFNIAVFQKAEKIVVIEEVLYHYIKPPHVTLVSTYNPEFHFLSKLRYKKEYELLKNADIREEKYYQAIRDIYIKHILSVFVRDLSDDAKLSTKDRISHIKEVLNDPETTAILKESNSKSKSIKVLETVFRYRMVYLSAVLAKAYSIFQRSRNK